MQSVQQLDLRLVSVAIEVNGRIKTYDQNFTISANGNKYANQNQNECEVSIYNLDRQTQDYLLSETSPFNKNKTPKTLTLYAGRVSIGLFKVFSGTITASLGSQAPDISVTLKSLTANYQKGNLVAKNATPLATLQNISAGVASDLGLALNFQATNKQIANYNFTGGVLQQVNKLNGMGGVNAFVDNDTLIVKNADVPLANTLTLVNETTGMIGIPEITEEGVKVKFLIKGNVPIGGRMRVQSTRYPAVNGDYSIYQLGFEITSRDDPFYWVANGKRL
jgi:hypothetical protein